MFSNQIPDWDWKNDDNKNKRGMQLIKIQNIQNINEPLKYSKLSNFMTCWI